ncbi:MAG: hypothetical protein DI539_19440 [Flavobacterium psychrophilum]|nr:MAG: hypothetical protein DI539_19440 [Flavobacterium psychrophilum]
MKTLLIVLVSFFVFSCNWLPKDDKKADGVLTKKNAPIHLLDTLKSYEPSIYKGTVPKAFYTHRGIYDWWRFPLVYPYAILCIDVTEYGSICNDKSKTDYDAGGGAEVVSPEFDKFIFDRSYFIGSKFKTPFDKDQTPYFEQYFIFSFSKGSIKEVSGKGNLYKLLKEMKFSGDTAFMTINEFGEQL